MDLPKWAKKELEKFDSEHRYVTFTFKDPDVTLPHPFLMSKGFLSTSVDEEKTKFFTMIHCSKVDKLKEIGGVNVIQVYNIDTFIKFKDDCLKSL